MSKNHRRAAARKAGMGKPTTEPPARSAPTTPPPQADSRTTGRRGAEGGEERRRGERIQAQKETVGLNRGLAGSRVSGSKKAPVKDTRPTLAEAGIDKKPSSRAQKLATVRRVVRGDLEQPPKNGPISPRGHV